MAELRMIAAATVMLGCGSADARSTGLAGRVPATWRAVPAIADAMRTASTAPGLTIDTAEAFGDPAAGCFAAHLALHGGDAAADALSRDLLEGLAAAKIATRDVATPTSALSLTFAAGAFRGKLRAQLGDGSVDALACFANDRDATACELACTPLLGAYS
jgi:hypothetical protein